MSPPTNADRATVRAAISFDANTDAAALKTAMKGMGTDEKLIIQILGRRTSKQRQDIIRAFKILYEKDLIEQLKKELSGDFEDVILSLMSLQSTYLAQELKDAMKGPGTKESTLIEILATNSNKDIKEIKLQYQKLFETPLEDDLRKETSGDFQKLLLGLSRAARDESLCDKSVAPKLAESLYNVGEKKKFGTDEAEFSRIVTNYSFPLLHCVFEEYEKIAGKSFEDAINAELSGDYKDAVMAIYVCATKKETFFANALHSAMKGLGTRNVALTRIIISRCEIDMVNIKEEYTKLYEVKLEEAVASETGGDFKKILLALIQG